MNTSINFIIPFKLDGRIYLADCFLKPRFYEEIYRISCVTLLEQKYGELKETVIIDQEIFPEVYEAARIEFKNMIESTTHEQVKDSTQAQINTEVKVTSQSVPSQETQEIEFTPGNPEEYQIDTIMGDDGIPMTPFDPGYWEKLIDKASEINEVKKD